MCFSFTRHQNSMKSKLEVWKKLKVDLEIEKFNFREFWCILKRKFIQNLLFMVKSHLFKIGIATLLIIIILLIIFLFFLLFNDFNFLSGQNLEQAKDTSSADVIVVLTGSSDRIKKVFELLEHNYSKRMFISGVNPIVRKNDLKKIIDLENSIEKNNFSNRYARWNYSIWSRRINYTTFFNLIIFRQIFNFA